MAGHQRLGRRWCQVQESGAPNGRAREIVEEARARRGSRGKIAAARRSMEVEAGLTLVQGAKALRPEQEDGTAAALGLHPPGPPAI
jgi:hypothetical protein